MMLLAAAGALAAADNPFVGKWKLNLTKSEFTGTTITYLQTGPDEMQATAEGQSYKFKMDSKEYPAFFGSVAAWKQLDGSTWETTSKTNGIVTNTDTVRVSADGKTMTVISRGKKPNGESFEDSGTLERVSGGPGLAGKWKTTKVNISSPEMMEIAPYEGDGISFKIAAYDLIVKAKFDGKDYPGTGPTVPPGMMLSLKKTGARSFEMTGKMSGKTVYTEIYSLSADGKTLTSVGMAPGTSEKVKAVYDRQ
jgi:hypothetical protein